MKALQFSVTVPQWVACKALGMVNRKFFYDGPFATVKLVDIPEPRLPSPEWVGIKTLLCGFCASDFNLICLKDSPTASPFTSFPCVIGHEICGEVVEVGAKVTTGLKVGDLVTIAPHLSCAARGLDPLCRACATGRVGNCENFARGNLAPGMFTGICADTGGGFGEYFVAHQSQVFRLPASITPEEAALVEPFSVALQAVLDNRPHAGEHVLIIGGGVIGSMLVRAIRALDIDCRITVAEPSRFHGEVAKRSGADNIIADGDLFTHTARITGAVRYKPMIGKDILMGGFARIFDAVGSSKTLNQAMRCMAIEGTLSIVGIGHDVKLDLTPLWLKLQTIRGVLAYGYTDIEGEDKHIFDVALDLITLKKASLVDMATHKFSIDEFRTMIEVNSAKGKHQAIKTMMTFM